MRENKLVNYSVIFMAIVLLAILLKTFQPVLRPLAIATLFFFIVMPLARYSSKKKIPVWLTFTIIFSLLVVLLTFLSSFITVKNLDLKNALPRYQVKISQESGDMLGLASKLGFGLEEFTPEKLSKLATKGGKMVLNTIRTIFSESLLALILLMFIAQSYAGLFRFVEARFGTSEVERLKETFGKIEGDIIAYLGTKTAMSLGTAMGTGIVLFFFKAKFIYVSLLLVFMLNFIPVIGSFVAVFIIVILYMLTFGLSADLAWLFLMLMAVQVLFGSILEPKIAGDRLNISPILIIVSLYVWGWIWGIIGMLLSVPLTIFILIIIKHMQPGKNLVE